MRAVVRTFTIPERRDPREIRGDLYAAAVLRAATGFLPDGLRQVNHQLLHSSREVFEVHRAIPRFERRVARALERLDVAVDGFRLAHLFYGVIGLHEHERRLVVRESEDVHHRVDAGRRPVVESLDAQLDVAPPAHLRQVLYLLPAVFMHAPPVAQRGLGDHDGQVRRGAVDALEDLLPAQPGLDSLPPPGRGTLAGLELRRHVGLRLQQAGQHERHEDADAGRVVLVAGELVVEDLAVVSPPGPDPAVHRQFLDLFALLAFDAVDADEVADVAHLRALPLVGLEAADLAAPPVQNVADMVGGVPGFRPEFREAPGQPSFRDGRAIGVIAHPAPPLRGRGNIRHSRLCQNLSELHQV